MNGWFVQGLQEIKTKINAKTRNTTSLCKTKYNVRSIVMAEINLRLVYNKNTSKHDIYIDYESDADALPFEHEQEHKDIVQSIIQRVGLDTMTDDDFGEIIIRRLSQEEKQEVLQEQREREAQKQQK